VIETKLGVENVTEQQEMKALCRGVQYQVLL
jgi:hypothetical protein